MNPWTIIRIFVSSTFKDMDVERDALRNLVVPRLNDHFVGLRVNIQLVDLRHSVETDSQLSIEERENRVYDICMDEINSCKPFFLGLVGHRYGWIPNAMGSYAKVQIPKDFPIKEEEISVTISEFLHALNNQVLAGQALILMRDEKSYVGLPSTEVKDYVDEGKNGKLITAFRNYLAGHQDIFPVEEPYTLNLADIGGKSIEQWSKGVYLKLEALINKHIGDSEALAEESFIKAQKSFINRHVNAFKGREDVIEECILALDERKSLYIYQAEHGLGQTALLCKLYERLNENKNCFCLFNSYETSPEARHYNDVFYYWNVQMLRFLGQSIEYLSVIRYNTLRLYEEFCKLCYAIYEQKNVIVVVFQDNPQGMDDYYKIRQGFNMYVQTISVENDESAKTLGPYILGRLKEKDFNLIVKNQRRSIISHLQSKKNSYNVKWLSMAINILNSLNKLDYQEIRKTESREDKEKNIDQYLKSVIDDMPDTFEDLSIFWVTRLQHVLGKEFVSTYIGLLGVSQGLTAEDLGQITKRNYDWCVYFKHLLGNSVIKEDENGYYTLQKNIVSKLVKGWVDDHRHQLYHMLNEYIKQLPTTSPTYQKNIFTTAMGMEDYETCLSYISTAGNFFHDISESPSMMAYYSKSILNEDDYFIMVKRMIEMAPIEYNAFHGLNQWCNIVNRRDNYKLYLRTAQLMIDKLEKAESEGLLDASTTLALVEIYFNCGMAYVELPDGEEQWGYFNEKQLRHCLAHFNESIDWNARLMSSLFDRYEGFADTRERWKFIQDIFIPLEEATIDYDTNSSFRSYVWLLRDSAILSVRFGKEEDALKYAIKALSVSKELKDRQMDKPDKGVDSDDFINEWVLCVWHVYRILSQNRNQTIEELNVYVNNAINEMKIHIGRRFCDKKYSVIYSQLICEHVIRLCQENADLAMQMTDDLLDLIIFEETPDDFLNAEVSQKNISFITRVSVFMQLNKHIFYSDISLAWALTSRYYISSVAPQKLNSRYAIFDDEIDTVMKLANSRQDDIWDRQLDPNFVMLTAIYVNLLKGYHENFPDKYRSLKLFDDYRSVMQKAISHYRYFDYVQLQNVEQLYDKFVNAIAKRRTFQKEELEKLIKEKAYDVIIQNLCGMNNGSKEEFFYLGLAYLRKHLYKESLELYKTLLGIGNLPEKFFISCKVNFLFALLVSGQRDTFDNMYKELNKKEQEDRDVKLLYSVYMDSLNTYEGRIDLPKPYGFML